MAIVAVRPSCSDGARRRRDRHILRDRAGVGVGLGLGLHHREHANLTLIPPVDGHASILAPIDRETLRRGKREIACLAKLRVVVSVSAAVLHETAGAVALSCRRGQGRDDESDDERGSAQHTCSCEMACAGRTAAGLKWLGSRSVPYPIY